MRSPSLKTVLAVSFAGLSCLATASAMFAVNITTTNRLRQVIGGDLAGVAEQMAGSLDRGMESRLHDVEAIAAIVQSCDLTDANDVRRAALRDLQQATPLFARLSFIGRDGRLLAASDDSPVGKDFSAEEDVRKGLRGPFVGDVHDAATFSPDDGGVGSRFVDLAAPVSVSGGHAAGVVVAQLHWRWAAEVHNGYAEPLRRRRAGAEMLVLARDGTVLLGPSALMGRILPASLLAPDGETHGDWRVTRWLDRQPNLVAQAATNGFGDFAGLGWRVVVRQDLYEAMAPARRLRNTILATGLGVTALAAMLGWWLAGWIARPFESMSRAALSGEAVPRRGLVVRELRDSTAVLADAALALRRQSQVLRRQAAEMRAVYEGTPLPLALLDTELRCIAASDALCAAFDIPNCGSGGLAGEVLHEKLAPPAGSVLAPVLRQVIATGITVRELELPVQGVGGMVSNWLFSITPVRLGGTTWQISGVSVAALNITDRRQAEDLLRQQASTLEARVRERTAALESEIAQRNRAEAALIQAQRIDAVGQLTGGVAHDFNNLLTAVLGSLELAEGITPDQQVLRLIRSAQGAAKRGATLTGQLLAFSRKQHLNIVRLEMGEVVQGMKDLLRRTLGPALRIEYRLCPELWDALADRNQLELSLLNLAINARDASLANPGGGIAIETCNMSGNDPDRPDELPAGDYVTVAVTDQGSGMPPDVLARCMEPFFTTKPLGKGTGLGLSMVLGVAQQSGGTMRISSLPGKGTTVRVFLPRAGQAIEAAPITVAELRHPPGYGFPGLRVLMVDDDEDVREITAAQLAQLGCITTVHADGAQALRALAANPAGFDMLVTDFAMPGMSGGELAQAARQLRPDLPVVLVTGYAELPESDGKAPPFSLLGKPYTGAELARILRVALAETGQLTAM